ncbi:MAG: enoyl-CoA hydratase/isomerase family protein [Halobacteriota archaeon]
MDCRTDDGVVQITFDRPAAMNAFTSEAAVELAEHVSTADPDRHHAIVLTGRGAAFSAGGDVQAMAERDERASEAYERVRETFGSVFEAMFDCPVPIVAKVNGDAVGAGLSITALSDFAYAAADATFSCAFVRVGLIPDTGGTFLLPKLVGVRTAKRLAFTGEFFGAADAAEFGLINEAVPEADLDDRVEDVIEVLRNRPTETIGLTKRAIHENLGRGWSEAVDYEHALQVQAYLSAAHEEGVRAFLEGRSPQFE